MSASPPDTYSPTFLSNWSLFSFFRVPLPISHTDSLIITCLCVLIILSLGSQYNHLYSISVCSLSWPIFCHHSFVILSSLSIWSSSASNATSCILKNIWLSNLHNSQIISCPDLWESATLLRLIFLPIWVPTRDIPVSLHHKAYPGLSQTPSTIRDVSRRSQFSQEGVWESFSHKLVIKLAQSGDLPEDEAAPEMAILSLIVQILPNFYMSWNGNYWGSGKFNTPKLLSCQTSAGS